MKIIVNDKNIEHLIYYCNILIKLVEGDVKYNAKIVNIVWAPKKRHQVEVKIIN